MITSRKTSFLGSTALNSTLNSILLALRVSLPLLALTLVTPDLSAAELGAQLVNPDIRDASDKPAKIPDFGKKVLAIFYTDPDVADQNDPFADKLKAAKLDEATYKGIGVANLKDTWLPNSVIRAMVRRKIEKYDATILTDPNRLLATAWKLGDCNEKSAVIVVDKTGKLRYLKLGAMTQAEMNSTFDLVKKLMAE